jgi:conserved oligomeric Golgi complex subunit 2
LKILRSSMIELINEDYADFVNLSANFVNLDKSISKIKDPLVELREEILGVRASLQECMNEINECLNEKRRFRQIKKSLKTLEVVRNSLEKMTKLLESVEASDKTSRAILLERAALEIIQLQFNVKYCRHFLEADEKKSIDDLEAKLLKILNEYFLTTLEANDASDNLERCLRIYYTLDQCALAENIFRKEVLKHMDSVISEKNHQNHPNSLAGVYNQILDFVSAKMKSLLILTRGKTMKIKGYNFLFNSFWAAIEEKIETNLSSIFAPGDPQSFYQKYKCTLEFLTRVEMIIGDDPELVEKFHQHPQYKRFQNKWNLPVYFQIRFQEIATSLEKMCEIDWNNMLATGDSNQMQVKVFVEVISCVAKCWMDGIYLDQLFHKFFKLTFQLIARASHWIQEVLQATAGHFEHPTMDLQSFYTVLHRDIGTFMLKLPQIEQLITQKLLENPSLKDKIDARTTAKCFEAPRQSLEGHQRTIESQIVQKMMLVCMKSIRNVQDIPRLFRKTNREVPAKHLPYVDQIVQPVDDFAKKNGGNYQADVVRRILKETFNQLTIQ